MTFGERLATARKKAGLSQADLAAKLGLSAGTVAGWETTGEHAHGIRMERLHLVAEALGVEVAELVA